MDRENVGGVVRRMVTMGVCLGAVVVVGGTIFGLANRKDGFLKIDDEDLDDFVIGVGTVGIGRGGGEDEASVGSDGVLAFSSSFCCCGTTCCFS